MSEAADVDLAVIGAGPAGIAAALEGALHGLSVLLLEEQPAPGGQIWRGIEASPAAVRLGADYAAGAGPVAALRRSGVEAVFGAAVWHLDAEGRIAFSQGGTSHRRRAARVVLATGAMERPVPIPGWTLPGVMTAGAAQIMLKTSGALPEGPCVLAGQGPLLWLVASQLIALGAPPALLLETRRAPAIPTALRHLPGLWAGRRWLRQGLTMMARVRRAGVRVVPGVRGLRAEGEGRLARVAWEGGAAEAALLLLHEGVVPETHITTALGLEHAWDAAQSCWRPVLDDFGASSAERIAVAGDGAGILGWQAAAARGALAGLDAGARLGRIGTEERDRLAAPHQAEVARARAFRPFLDALYAPAPELLCPPDDATLICRCEEVTAGQLRAAVRLGAQGPNQAKAYLRCGMGPCQGRMCGATVAAVIAGARGLPIQAVDRLRPRSPYRPVTVRDLAGIS